MLDDFGQLARVHTEEQAVRVVVAVASLGGRSAPRLHHDALLASEEEVVVVLKAIGELAGELPTQ